MAKYSIEDTTLTGMSDAVRGLNGDTAKRTPSQMMTAIAEASGEVTAQTDLLEQVLTALDGKVSGGSADNPELVTLINKFGTVYYVGFKDELLFGGESSSSTTSSVVKGSVIRVFVGGSIYPSMTGGFEDMGVTADGYQQYKILGDVTINKTSGGGSN